MCGIFGWITPGRPVDRARAAAGTNRMRHRGPDDEGYLLASLNRGQAVLAGGEETSALLSLPRWDSQAMPGDADVMLGFRRLSIHDLSEAGHQPMGTPDGKLWIVFNGEVYNFIELRAELERRGIVFRSGTDTEVILRAYEAWGPACLQRFNGMWGLAILDLRNAAQPELLLARDRCGVKALFYAEDGQGGVAFASELKAVLATRDQWSVHRLHLSNFVAWGRNPGARDGETLFKEVRQLPPGCLARLTPAGLRVERWWDLPASGSGEAAGEEEAVQRLRELVEDAVALRLRADVPVGSCLSGGVDSSIIVGTVNRMLQSNAGATHSGGTQHTFSAVYEMEGPFNERRFIDRVLSTVKAQAHYTIPSPEGLVRDFDALVWHQDEPFSTTSIFAQWCVMRLVKERGTTVLLDGQAADELFAGYRPYRWHFTDLMRGQGIAAAVTAARELQRETGDRTAKALLAGIGAGVLPEAALAEAARLGYRRALHRAAGRLLSAAPASSLVAHVMDSSTPESYPWRRTAESMDAHLRGLVLDFCLPHLLRFEDRNSMAFSIEARVPFTDYRIVEYAFSPAMQPLKIHRGWPKWALREAGRGTVPEDILWRRDKMGFGTPEPWLIRELAKASGKDLLEAALACGDLSADGARKVMAEAAAGTAGKAGMLEAFRLMVLGSWWRQFGRN